MRTSVAAQDSGIAADHRVTRIYVEVWDGSQWVDLTALADEQWVNGFSGGENESRTVPRYTLRLHRETHETSLAPLVQDPPLLVAGARMRVGVAVWERGEAATGREELIEGRIETVDWAGTATEITVDIRDLLTARLHDTLITEEFTVPAGNLQECVQHVLDEWTPGITVLIGNGTPGDFSFPLGGTLRPQKVESAVRYFIDQAGWDMRRRYVSGAWRLVLFEPQDPSQDPPVADATLTPRRYYEIPAMGLTSVGFRDQVVVKYLNAAATVETTATAETPTPAFGDDYRAFVLDERQNQTITSEAQAQTYGAKALLATARIAVGMQVVLPLDWRIELADWLEFEPDARLHAANFEGAVTSIRHAVEPGTPGGGTTTLEIRGAFAGRIQTWVERIRRTRVTEEVEDVIEPPVDPLDLPGDADWYYTTAEGSEGFSEEGERDDSLGKYIATTRITAFELNDVFRPVTPVGQDDGITLYRVIALANTHDALTWEAVKVYLPDAGESADIDFHIGLDPAGVVALDSVAAQGVELVDEETAPGGGVSFSQPTELDSGLDVGDIGPEECILVHLRLTIASETTDSLTGGQICAATCPPSDP